MREYRDYYNSSQGPRASLRFGFGFTPAVKVLLLVNVAAFVLANLLAHMAPGWDWPGGVLTEEWQRDYLFIWPNKVLEEGYAWQLLTSMFLHADFAHILFNLLALFLFGPLCEERYGVRKFCALYFGAGLAGGLAFILSGYFQADGTPALGASGAIMGVVIAAAALRPDMTIHVLLLIPMRLRTLAILLVLYDLYHVMFYRDSQVAAIAHIGGMLFGFLFVRYQLRVANWFFRIERRNAMKEQRRAADTRRRVEELLEKINRDGMESLSRKEMKFLRRASDDYGK